MSQNLQQQAASTSYSEPGEPIPHHYRRRRRRGLWHRFWRTLSSAPRSRLVLAVIGVLIFVCGFTVVLGYLTAGRIEQQLWSGQWQLNRAIAVIAEKPLTKLSMSDLKEADQQLLSAENWFRQAQAEVKPYAPLLNIVGGDAGALPHLTDAAVNATVAGQELYAGLEPLLTLLLAEPDSPSLAYRVGTEERIIAPLLAGQPRLQDARRHLAQALAASKGIDRATLSDEMAAAVDEVDDQLPRLYKLADTLIALPDLLTSLLGLHRQTVYLVMAQNNDELRPTGGWVGTYGVLVIEDGKIVDYEYHSTQPPNLTPPSEECPVKSPTWWIQLQQPVWGCWDAQWTADFPTLAQQAEWFYEHGGNPHAPVDGVIAIDLIGAETLLEALGPVKVPAYGEVIDAKNMRTRIYYYRAQEGDQPHKQFVASLFEAIVGNLAEVPPKRVSVILDALWQSLKEKHLLFYFDDPALQALATELGGDGAIRPTTDDYLFVVDSSLTTKGYSSIEETIEYEVIINPDGSLTGQVTLNWFFPSNAVQTDPAIAPPFSDPDHPPDFLDFARVYVPQGSVWSGTEGNDSPTQFAEEGGKLMLGNRLVVAPGKSRQIRHHYLVPDKIQRVGNRSYYRLTVQKQPGTRAHWLTVRVTLPTGVELVTTKPKASSVYELRQTVVEFRTRLATDQTFQIVFR